MNQPLAAAAVRLEHALDAYRSGDNAAAREQLQLAVGALEQSDFPATAALVVELASVHSRMHRDESLEQLAELCASWASQHKVAA